MARHNLDSTELEQAVLLGQAPLFHPNTGQNLSDVADISAVNVHFAAAAGLDVPRYCQLCGRRMVVQVRPDGWSAHCSRHGTVDSSILDR
ncbi:hypothetical protein GC425_04030 [Corynebacterium sp. zg254]|uniref:Biotin synthase auxiliary protein n=1 Tax=Corynebacterium zhongnanshanii TaxID=2768834 RepID=A0ABQ6VF34_9CORY|nr:MULTISPECIES: hypothetical protein [Corynebacterium]KAB3522890.1 hypothetical protein F8377_01590 [Corynebacterium zhongnanshanii]MCR5914039.1 hypothetical protein [Corynebacterium sp. zg254]